MWPIRSDAMWYEGHQLSSSTSFSPALWTELQKRNSKPNASILLIFVCLVILTNVSNPSYSLDVLQRPVLWKPSPILCSLLGRGIASRFMSANNLFLCSWEVIGETSSQFLLLWGWSREPGLTCDQEIRNQIQRMREEISLELCQIFIRTFERTACWRHTWIPVKALRRPNTGYL